MSYQDTAQSSICRIVGLHSEQGKKCNGSAGRVRLDGKQFAKGSQCSDDEHNNEIRYPVCCDGFTGPLSLKASNIELFPNEPGSSSIISSGSVVDLTTGVGRGTFLDKHFQIVLVENGVKIDNAILEGESARCRGTLDAMAMFNRKYGNVRTKKCRYFKLTLTDLNMSRAFNRVANGDTEVQLGPSLQSKFKKICKQFPKNSEHVNILVKFDSHRVHADRFPTEIHPSKQGPQRYNAAKEGTYQIYPCPLKQYLDALEVKYIDVGEKKKQYAVLQDIYLDYGKSEAIEYVHHATAMNECYRLFPDVLAEVDPQMFWSCILWMESVIQTLEQMSNSALPAELIDAWKDLEGGREKSRKSFAMGIMPNAKGPEENWGIGSKSSDVHLRVATDFAINAIQVMQIAAVPKIPTGSQITMNILDYYTGTDLDKYMEGQIHLMNLLKQEQKDISDSRMAHLYNKAMRGAGLKRDERFRMQDPEKMCSHCGKKSKNKLLLCARCEGVSYCDSNCQRAHWKVHRSNCSRVFVQLQKKLDLLKLQGAEVTTSLYNYGSTSLPTQSSMFSEVSGTGMASIFWNPNGESMITVGSDLGGLLDGGATNTEMIKRFKEKTTKIKFHNLSELDPVMRFLLCCGPLPDLQIAKDSVSDALTAVGGNIQRIRFPVVGFTPLEWAAKKGNMETIKWLCTDKRTKSFLQIGCPVGWSCYTGQVDIARLLVNVYNVDAQRTDVILWNSLSPLFVAAQNGQFEALKFLVIECGMNINATDELGRNVLKHIETATNWRDLDGHKKCRKWAKKMME